MERGNDEWGRDFITHDKILRDIRPILEALESKDKAAYVDVEKELLAVYGRAVYRLEQAKFRAKNEHKK